MFEFLKKQRIILASKSPRRADILKQLKIDFEIIDSEVAEEPFENDGSIEDYVMRISDKKVMNVAKKITDGIIIAADTIVTIDGQILGKPENRDEAKNMLKRLSGRIHCVYTGVSVVLNPGFIKKSDYEMTEVKFRKLDEDEINYYVDSGEPMDKAGSYGIQDLPAIFVEKIDGCFFNVVGLPLTKVYLLMKSMLK